MSRVSPSYPSLQLEAAVQERKQARASYSKDDRRRADYLHVLNRAWLAFGVIALATIPFYRYWQVSLAIVGASLVTLAIVEWLLRMRRVRTASIVFCVCVDLTFLAIFLILAQLLGPAEVYRTQAPTLMLMGLTALFAAALIGPRAALVVAAINSVIVVGLRLAIAPDTEPRPGVLLFYWMLAAVAFLYENTLNGVFAELRGVRDGLEKIVAQRTAELRNSITELEGATRELSATNHDLDLFSVAVAHELRNPLLVIEGYSRVLQSDPTRSASSVQALDGILGAEARMHRLIDGLLAFARLGHHALRKEPVRVREIAERLCAELAGLEPNRKISSSIDALPDCFGDPILIEQVLANLIGNAIKFTRGRVDAEIRIRGERQQNELVYCVQDNGVGFPMELAGRLFSPLHRLHSQKEFEGTGIGLAAVDRMIRLHGGRVWASSEPDKGAAFFFALPVAANETMA